MKAFKEEEAEKGKGKGKGKRALEEVLEGKAKRVKVTDMSPPEVVKEETVQQEMGEDEEMPGGGEKTHSDLRVLSKETWRRLRNKYLNEQRKNFSQAKQSLKKQWSPYRESQEAVNKARALPVKKWVKEEVKDLKEMEQVPGVIVRISIADGVDSIQGVKKSVREALGGEGVGYVDTRVGAQEVMVRCVDQKQAGKLVGVGEVAGGKVVLVKVLPQLEPF